MRTKPVLPGFTLISQLHFLPYLPWSWKHLCLSSQILRNECQQPQVQCCRTGVCQTWERWGFTFEIPNRNSQDEMRSTVTVVWWYQALPLRLPASHPLGKCLALTSGSSGSGFYCQSPKRTSEKYLHVQQSWCFQLCPLWETQGL